MRRLGRVAALLAALVVAGWLALLVWGGRPGKVRTLPPGRAESRGVLAIPVAGFERSALADSWGDPRDNGLRPHHGTDLPAPRGTPVVAAADGSVEKIWTSKAGGLTLYVRSPGRDWTYYYAHLAGYASGLHEGQAVRAGDPLGFVGDTGDAGAGNFHLHFGLTRTTPAQRWWEGEDVDPYPYLAGKPVRVAGPGAPG